MGYLYFAGKRYKSRKELCEEYGVSPSTVQYRLKNGMSLEAALRLGNEHLPRNMDLVPAGYRTVKEACNANGITESAYYGRVRRCLSPDEAISCSNMGGNRGKAIVDPNGRTFSSMKDMCIFWKADYNRVYQRLRLGWSVEKALTYGQSMRGTKTTETVTDHTGKEFKSVGAMCEYWGINRGVYYSRRSLGWDLKRILTTPVAGYVCYDHLGNKFGSQCKMCEYWGITTEVFFLRKKAGLSLEECLTGKVAG